MGVLACCARSFHFSASGSTQATTNRFSKASGTRVGTNIASSSFFASARDSTPEFDLDLFLCLTAQQPSKMAIAAFARSVRVQVCCSTIAKCGEVHSFTVDEGLQVSVQKPAPLTAEGQHSVA